MKGQTESWKVNEKGLLPSILCYPICCSRSNNIIGFCFTNLFGNDMKHRPPTLGTPLAYFDSSASLCPKVSTFA
ncbi:hypothetical protein RRG08_021799 [Elysia crispata]|uniref:Uncharacterized protein n=1 Tax=Elysia crispata TaxID=231223 RepID=A0AAE1DQ59_9GAST|nr:hypothetical protein RRG08_021799 [Elysia crispata]